MKHFSTHKPVSAATRLTVRILIAALMWSNIAGVSLRAALAGPIADPTAALAFRPTLVQAGNGVPVVNITAPNAAGISLNRYQSFNVDSQGVILNNSRTGGSALLGPGIAANPNLLNAGNGQNGRSAQTIVNEVSQSGPPSVLAGTVEVFGAPAAVIIANPNGITCNGCGVLNTPRLSLIAGSSSLQGGAGFASATSLGWDVPNGQIVITSQGLEGTVGRLDLLGQTIQIQGPLRAHYLNQELSSINLGAGRQQFQLQGDGNFTASSTAAVPTATATAATIPSFAIDATALGAMTAGQIRIVSTSDGLGVNLRGPLIAYQQGIHINSAGALTVNDASAVGDIQLVSGGKLTATQNLNAGGAITASSGAGIQLQGNTLAVGNIELQSAKESSIDGVLKTGGDLLVQAGSIQVTGSLQAQRDLTLKAGDIAVNAKLTVGRNYSATASNTLVQDGNSTVGNSVSLQADATTLGGSLAAPQTRITGGSLLVGTGAASALTGDLLVDVQGRVEVRDTLSVQGGNLGIQAGSIQIGGAVLVAHDMQLQASDIAVNANVVVGRDYSASAGNTLVQDGNTTVGNSVSLQAKAITLGGDLAAPQTRITGASLVVGTSGATNITGKLLADLQGPVQVRNTLDVQGDASISSAGDQTLLAPINTTGALTLQAGGSLSLMQGASAGGAALLVSGGGLTIAGPVSAGEITASGASADINGALNSVGNIHLAATNPGGNLTLNAPLHAGNEITVQSGGKLLANSSITSSGTTQLSATGALRVTGTINASSLGLSGAGINVSGSLQSPGSIALASSQSLDIGGDVRSGNAVNLQTAGSLSVSGSVTSASAATLVANRDLSVQGSVNAASISASAGHDASFGGNLTSSAGAVQLNAGGNLTVAGTVDAAATTGAIDLQSGGQLSVGGGLRSTTSIQLIANGSASIGGPVQSGATTVMQAGGDLQLLGSSTAVAGQTLRAGGNVDVQGGLQAGALDVQGQNVHIGGAVDIGGSTQLQAASTLAVDGHLQAGGAIAISAGAGGAALRQVQGNGDVNITSLGNLRTDALTAGGDLSAQAGGSLQVQGVFGANGNLRGAAGQSITVSGTAQAGGTLQLDASVGDIQIQGDLASRANLNANAGGKVTVQGSLQTGGDLHAHAGGNLSVGQDTLVYGQAHIQAGGDSRGGGALQAGNGLQLQAGGAVIQQGATLVLGDATISSGGAHSWGQTLQDGVNVSGKLQASAGNGIAIAGALQVNQDITLRAGTGGLTGGIRIGGPVSTSTNAQLLALGDITLGGPTTVPGQLDATSSAGSITFSGKLGVRGNLNASAQQNLRFLGDTVLLGQTQLQAQTGQIYNLGRMQLAQGLSLNTPADFANDGLIESPGNIRIQARNISSNVLPGSAAGGMLTEGQMSLTASNTIAIGSAGTLSAATGMQLSSIHGASNSGTVQSGAALRVNGSYSNNGLTAAKTVAITGTLGNSGTLYADTVQVAQATSNSGQLGAINMQLADLVNSGNVSATTLNAGATVNSGSIVGGSVTIAGALNNAGSIGANGSLFILGGNVDNSGSLAGQSVDILGSSIVNSGQIQASGSLNLAGGTLLNSGGESVACPSGNCTLPEQFQWSQHSASISAGSNLTAQFSDITNQGSLSSQGSMTLTAGNSFTNQRNVSNLIAGAAGGASGATASISAGGTISINASTLSNIGGAIHAGGNLALNASGALSSTALQPGLAGSLTGSSITANGASISNEGRLQATSGEITLTSASSISNNGADAAIAAPQNITLDAGGAVANQSGALILADSRIAIQGSSFANAGTVYGQTGPTSDIRIQTSGAISNAASGIVITGNTLQLQGSSYSNAGAVGSLGDATLQTAAAYSPGQAPLIAKGQLDLQVAGITVAQGSSWVAGAANTRWSGALVNYGTVYLGGNASGSVQNLASGSRVVSADPAAASAGSYAFNLPTLGAAQAVFYTDVASRAFFGVGGSFTGAITNVASDVAAGGSFSYTPASVAQSVFWRNGAGASETTAALSLPRLYTGSGVTSITLTTPDTGTIVADSLNLTGGSLTVGGGIDASAAGRGVLNAQTAQAGSGSTGSSVTVSGSVTAASPTVLAGATTPGASGQAAPANTSAASPGAAVVAPVSGLSVGTLQTGQSGSGIPTPTPVSLNAASPGGQLDLSSPQAGVAALLAGSAQVIFPDWSQLRIAPGSLSANDLNLHLSGSFTNMGSFGVSRDLLIDAAGGIDNSGAALRAGGRMQLFGGALNNQAGMLQAGSLYAGIDGAIWTQGGSIQTQGNAWLGASGAIQAQRSDLSSASGNFILSAGGEIDLTHASLRAKGTAGALAGGSIALDDASVDGNTIALRAAGDIQGNAVTLTSRGDTTVQAGGNLQIGAQALHASSGSGNNNSSSSDTWQGSTIASRDGNVSASAGGLLDLQGSDLKAAGKLQLSGQQVRIEALQARSESHSEEQTGGERFIRGSQTVTSTGAQLQGGTGVSIAATGELTLQGARIESGAGVSLSGANVSLSANVDASSSEYLRSGRNQFARTTSEQQSLSGAIVQAAGDISIVASSPSAASGNIALAGAQLSAGTTTLGVDPVSLRGSTGPTGAVRLLATGDIDIAAVSTQSSASQDNWRKQSGWFSSTTSATGDSHGASVAQGSDIRGNSVTLQAGQIDQDGHLVSGAGNITLTGSGITAAGQASLQAGRDITLSTATQTETFSQTEQKSKSGLSISWLGIGLGKSASNASASGDSVKHIGASVSAGAVSLQAGRDTNVVASAILSDTGIDISAGRDINVLAAYDRAQSGTASHSSGSSIGLAGNQTGLSYTRSNQSGSNDGAAAATSVLSANAGSLNLTAGTDARYKAGGQGNLTTQGADLLAQDKITLSANAVDLQAIADSNASSYHLDSKSVTLDSARLTGALGSLIQQGVDRATQGSSGSSGNDRLDNARALKFGYDLYKNAQPLADLTNGVVTGGADGLADAASGSAIGVSVSSQISQSQADGASSASTARGSNLQARHISISASEGDISMAGAKLQAIDISLDAAKNLNLGAASSSASSRSRSAGSSYGGGATFGFGEQNGLSFQANASVSSANAVGSETTYDNTQVIATNKLTLKSGGDTTLQGAQLAGKSVQADIGGNLTITSVQDASDYQSASSSAGFAVSVCVPPLCYGNLVTGTVSAASTRIEHHYQSAVGQSGIAAGEGGFDITVKGATTLTGGAITSTAADPDNNRLTTASLSSTDLQNRQATEADASTLSAGYSGASTGATLAANAASNVAANAAANASLPASGSQSGSTQSVISAGRITLTGTGNAQTDAQSSANVATLTARDPKAANGALLNTLTLQQAAQFESEQNKARQNAEAAQLVGGVLTNVVGDIGAANGWKDGSPEKTVLHGLVGIIEARLGGASTLSGFAAGVVNEKIVGQLSDYLESQGIHRTNADGTANKDYASFMVAGSTLAGAGVGALTGGGKAGNIAAGANIAGTATVNNYLRHDQWDALAAKLSACAGQASCEAAVNATYSGLSQLQDNALATCDSRGDCAKLIQDVQAGSARQQQLVQSGALTDNYLGAANLQAQGVKLTNDAGYRNQVAQSVTAAYVCKSDPGQCTRQAAYAVLGLAALVGGGAAAAIVLENAPQIAAAASLTIKACLQNMALCANQAGLTVADFLAADALGGASVAGGAAVVGAGAGKVVGGLGGEGKGVVGIKGAAAPELSVIGRVKDLQNLSASEKSLLDRLPYMGSPKANWAQNSGVLRQEMGRGLPIRDASPLDITGQFLNAERNLLMDRAWTFDRGSNLWMPPTP